MKSRRFFDCGWEIIFVFQYSNGICYVEYSEYTLGKCESAYFLVESRLSFRRKTVARIQPCGWNSCVYVYRWTIWISWTVGNFSINNETLRLMKQIKIGWQCFEIFTNSITLWPFERFDRNDFFFQRVRACSKVQNHHEVRSINHYFVSSFGL